MCEMVDPSNSGSTLMTFAAAIKTKIIQKTAIEVMWSRLKGSIRVKIAKGKSTYSKQ